MCKYNFNKTYMKKTLLLFSFLLALTTSAFATTFSYSNGSAGRSNVARVGTTELQGQLMRLNSDKVKMLAGKTISGAQAVIGSKNGSKFQMFIRETPDGANLAATENAELGRANQWADYAFAVPYVVKGTEENLYIGFTYEIATSYSPLSYDLTHDSKNLSYAYQDGKWVDTYGSNFGMPNIRLVTSEAFDFGDLMVKTFTPTGFMRTGGEYGGHEVQVLNIGTLTAKSFTAKVKVGDGEETVESYDNANLAPNAVFTIQLPKMVASQKGRQNVSVSIADIIFANDGTDADLSDNSCLEEVFVYDQRVTKRLLIEAFTGQHCSNCPSGHRALNTSIEELEANGVEVIEVAHHAGYQPDNFTTNEDSEYCFFYNNGGSTYAPAVMINRWKNPKGTYPGPVFNTGETLIWNNAVDALNQEPYVTVDMTCDYDEATREAKLKVDIDCWRKPEGTTVLNIMIAQDSIITYQTSGGTDYVHNNTCRGTIANNAWGINITNNLVEGKTLSYTTTYTLPETIRSTAGTKIALPLDIPTEAKNMKFVAYVAAFDYDNPNGNEVYNCAGVKLMKDDASSISSVMQNAGCRMQNTYNLAGQKVGENYRGIVIKNGKKVLIP